MERSKYMRIPAAMLSKFVIDLYNLQPFLHNGYVYVCINRSMFGLLQAGHIASKQLIRFLKPHGYVSRTVTPGLWKHSTQNLHSTPVVNDFGVKDVDRADVEHLISAIKKHCKCSQDWEDTRYCGLHLAWNYDTCTCNISMPGYIERAYNDSAIRNRSAPSILPMPGKSRNTEPKSNLLPKPMTLLLLMPWIVAAFKKYLAPSYTMPVPLTLLCWPPLAPSPFNKPRALHPPCVPSRTC
jgi:hypothetical protein